MSIITIYQEGKEKTQARIYRMVQKCGNFATENEPYKAGVGQTRDARYDHFLFIREDIQSYLLSSTLAFELLDISWWEKSMFKSSLESESDTPKYLNNRQSSYSNWSNSGFVICFFARAEHFLRMIARCYDSGSCSHINISTLFDQLKTRLGLPTVESDLFKIWALTRNTMHNGGIHTHPNATISYKGKDFIFELWKPANNLSPENMELLVTDMLELLQSIVQHADIKAIPLIEHDYSNITFS